MIDELAKHIDVSLALSLHAPNDELRNQLVPINKKYPLKMLLESCMGYMSTLGGKRVLTIEYTLLKDVNDQPEHAAQMIELLRDVPCKINLIPFNPFPHSGYERPSNNAIRRFGICCTTVASMSPPALPAAKTSMPPVVNWSARSWIAPVAASATSPCAS